MGRDFLDHMSLLPRRRRPPRPWNSRAAALVAPVMDAEVLRYVAFADAPRGGNPAGLVLDAAGLSEADMLRIAGEVGYSETAFVIDRADIAVGEPRRLRVRYYSPAAEVPFCGHATVALASALAEREGPGPFVFATQSGEVRLETSRVRTTMPSPSRSLSVEPATAPIPGLAPARPPGPAEPDPRRPRRRLPAPAVLRGRLASDARGALADRELFHQFSFAPKPLADLMGEEWAGTVHRAQPARR